MKAFIVFLADYFLGCRHPKDQRSWPRANLTRGQRGIYQNCLLCGKELPYRNTELFPAKKAA